MLAQRLTPTTWVGEGTQQQTRNCVVALAKSCASVELGSAVTLPAITTGVQLAGTTAFVSPS